MAEIDKVILSGTPGTGKSLFMIYLLWKLVKEGKRVLFIYGWFKVYYDGKGGVLSLTNTPPQTDLKFWNKTLWCLFDCKEKDLSDLKECPYGECNFILSTSPRRSILNDFKKPPQPKVFYMPLWSESELTTIAHCFPDVKDWKHRFEQLGGVPRQIFEIVGNKPISQMEAACSKCKLNDLIAMVGIDWEFLENNNFAHSLLHITSAHPYTEPSVCFASETALHIIALSKGKQAKVKMMDFLEFAEGNPLIAALYGYVFESYAIERLEKGGTFRCRMLGRTGETDLTIPGSKKKVAKEVLRNQPLKQLHVPVAKNYTSLDAWMPGVGGFQMTVGLKHRGLRSDLLNVLKMLGRNGKKLYWLLPPSIYNSFTKKSPKNIDQYAVLIPYPEIDHN